ncbi:hypothetical protein [Streptomyces europaeiscabiei]|uniref:hypothetical protein n=1 Tax=Streptomyces europaeiscabiei TaxID=146819 RepID=UPI0029A17C64|nr:hypothetical protein [Streptomyces europaeiscabiei]MDX3839789.1 hypothetical protein [Streptomyces europaeiscabiei]
MDALQHAFDLAARGLLTELPAQLVTAAVAAVTATAIRAWKKRRAAAAAEGKAER